MRKKTTLPAAGPALRPRGLKALSPLLLAALLASCAAVGPEYRAPDVVSPAAWHSGMDGGLGSGEMNPDASAQWWHQFGDPTLSELIEKAILASPDLRSAQASLREARARRAIAGAAFFPTVGASLSGRRNSPATSAAGKELYSAGFDASWEPDVFGGIRRSAEAAQADMERSEATLATTRISLLAELALNYVEFRALQARLAIARSNLESQSETLQLTDWRAQAGLVGSLEMEQAQANLEQTRAQIPLLETNLAEAQNRLSILVGDVPGSLGVQLARPASIPGMPHVMAVGIPADTLRRRPDVRAAERRLAAETARVGQAQAARYPSISLSGSIGLDSLTLDSLGSGTARRSFIASIAATLFDAGRLKQQVIAQDAVREQAMLAYESTVLTALEDVENALVAFARSKERQAALIAAAQAARNAAQLARQRYSSGVIDFQTVLDTERSVLNIEDSLAVAEADGASSVIRLYKALGGGWEPVPTSAASDK
ncbi:MAG TPA: efflux transporter outer membrane subunit [Noviherbaspirillum sp.]|nr:efflux transporter outer membrane subunit [Noviherbaspirillum sp.]